MTRRFLQVGCSAGEVIVTASAEYDDFTTRMSPDEARKAAEGLIAAAKLADVAIGRGDCCDAWGAAQKRGTDSEGYGALLASISYRTKADADRVHQHWSVGMDLPPVQFCPWCGNRKAVAK